MEKYSLAIDTNEENGKNVLIQILETIMKNCLLLL